MACGLAGGWDLPASCAVIRWGLPAMIPFRNICLAAADGSHLGAMLSGVSGTNDPV